MICSREIGMLMRTIFTEKGTRSPTDSLFWYTI
ncbi:hypothetical protein LINPERHAP1_LOCUS24595 [Linum perenne]